jgi:hypothetical protein
MRDQATFRVTARMAEMLGHIRRLDEVGVADVGQGGRGPLAIVLGWGGCRMGVRFALALGGRCFSGSSSRPAWRVDLTGVSAERERQEPSMSISVAIRVTDVSGSPQTRVGRRSHA